MRATGMRKMVTMAKYLPSTIPVRVTGEVSSSWSVRLWRSSAMDFMVSRGMAKSRMLVRLYRV